MAETLCLSLYGSTEAVSQMRLYSLLIPMLYCDCITDAMTKGLGQQKICVRYNIITSTLDVIFLYFLLPKYGMAGYFLSFTLTHMLNFCLSIRRLILITGETFAFRIPMIALGTMAVALLGAGTFTHPCLRLLAYCAILFSLWTLSGIVSIGTLHWVRGLIFRTAAKT